LDIIVQSRKTSVNRTCNHHCCCWWIVREPKIHHILMVGVMVTNGGQKSM